MILAYLAFGILHTISPTDSRIVYVGRFDLSDGAGPTCEWSASEVRLRVHGASVVASIESDNPARWEIVLDGKDVGPLTLKKGKDQYTIDLGQIRDHDLSLVRREEAFMGVTRIEGFDVPGGSLLRARPKSRHIEVIGDSITCGYGNEGKDQNEHFKPETENAYMSYASIAARELNADVTIIAWSGRKMWPNDTTPEIYDWILPTKPAAAFDFKGPAPAAIVINLATNDFGRGAPDEMGWTVAYEAFIRRLWSHYPKAQIYMATGSMMYGDGLATVKRYLQKISADLSDPRVHQIDFDVQKAENGYGSDWHPSVKTDGIMGRQLGETIKRDLHW